MILSKSQLFRFVFSFAILISLVHTPLLGQAGFGNNEKLQDDWSFSLTQQEVSDVAVLSQDTEDWQQVNLPHDWSVKGLASPDLASCTGYLPGGIAWYQKTLAIPSDARLGNKVFLYFEGVYNRSEVYLNGHLLGKRPNGYISFLYDATPFVLFDEPNTVAVKVDHSRQFDSRWYTGSGIYRDVWLVRSQPIHIAQWGVFAHTKDVSADRATFVIETELVNRSDEQEEVTVVQDLLDADGKLVGNKISEINISPGVSSVVKSEIKVKSPKLWSPEKPSLYQVRTKVLQGDKVVDQSSVTTGIRKMEFDPDKGFSLNGKNLKMKGVCLHHDAGVLGSAVPREVWKERLMTLKSIGCNAIRTSHNPQATALYELCDELGFFVLDEAFDEWEFPKRKWIQGWNVGEPGFEGSYDFFEEWGEQDVADMVRRDRNHPSIFAWSIGNEVDYPNDPYSHPILDGSSITQPMYGGYKPESPDANRLGVIAKKLVAKVKVYDTSRPVTAALAGVVMSNETEYPGALDIVGYNYTESRYHEDHKKYPNRVIYGSENRHDLKAWKAVTDNEYILGQFLWTGIDYLGESGRWPSRGLYSGLIDFGGDVKPRGKFRQALWSETPVIYIGTMKAPDGAWQSMDAWPIWNYHKGEKVRVLCYTNTPKAELMLNGSKVGKTLKFNNMTGIISWDISFEEGKLEVVGLDASDNELCRDSIVTHGPAATMQLVSNTGVIDHHEGLAIVELLVLDANGNRVMNASDEVKCEVDGPAKLLGLEASNNSDMSDMTDAVHRVFQGRIKAYIQATGEPGDVTVRFTAAGFPEADLHLILK